MARLLKESAPCGCFRRDLEGWPIMLEKVRRGQLFSDAEELMWFRRMAVLDSMKEEEFTPFGEYEDIYSIGE